MTGNNHLQTIQQLFDDYAEGFNSIYGDSHNRFQRWIDRRFRQSMRLRFERTVASCQPLEEKRILDVGCGPGQYSVFLAQHGAREIAGIDIAPRMIELARKLAREKGVPDRCTFLECDFMNYGGTELFDYTIVMGVMDYILEPKPFLQRLMSLTRDHILLSFPNDRGILARQRRWRYKWFSGCILNMYSQEKLVSLLEEIASHRYSIEPIARDYFVTIQCSDSSPQNLDTASGL